ncbi:MAG: putative phage tail protein [Oscillospiraceae bacterium]
MGYTEHLKALLRPLCVYELDEGSGASELSAMGCMFDGVFDQAETLEGECTVGTAQGYGLEYYEELLPKRPVNAGLGQRRKAISALMNIDGTSFTQKRLNETLLGCGIAASVRETEQHYTVEVTFPETKGVPDSIEEIKERIESILPCHLDCVYKYVFCTWGELETDFTTWESIEKLGTWGAAESYSPAQTE